MTRVVVDTDVMTAAIRSGLGASRRVLEAGLLARYSLLVSIPLMIEYEATMTRAEHLAASGLTRADVGTLLDAVAAVATPVRLAFLWRSTLKDANDDMVLETAVNGRADHLVTFNVRDFRGTTARFGIEVIAPGRLVQMLESRR